MAPPGLRWFEIQGDPFAWKRTGSSKPVRLPDGRQFSHRYEPKDQAEWKAWAKKNMTECMGGAAPLEQPVILSMLVVFAMPKGRHLKKSVRPRSWYAGKKDLDNIAKAVMDAGNGILWFDDRQLGYFDDIFGIVGRQGEAPRIEVLFGPAPSIDIVPQTLRPEREITVGSYGPMAIGDIE